MIRCALLFSLLTMIAQAPEEADTAAEAEVVRVLAIHVRDIPEASRHVDPSLASLQELLTKVPGNHFTEIGFHELEVPYGGEGRVDLGEGYGFTIRLSELTEQEEILFECHIDLTEGDGTVEALRVSGKAIRGQGAAFRGLSLDEGEMMVVMSIAQAEDDAGNAGSGGGGQRGEGGEGDGSRGEPGENGVGDGRTEEKEVEPVVPVVPSPPKENEDDDASPAEGFAVERGEGQPRSPDQATIEGILRALEEQDMAEQKNARSRRYDIIMRGDWW